MVEAQRCLGCHDAPCRQACPAHVDVPAFIRRFREENPAGAAETIYSACPLGNICGQVCPTGDLCEKACVLPGHGAGAHPHRRAAGLHHFPVINRPRNPVPAGGKRVAVVGAGPAGLGCAVQLNRLGEEVHVFEGRDETCGLVGRVIPLHRLPANRSSAIWSVCTTAAFTFITTRASMHPWRETCWMNSMPFSWRPV